MNYTETWNKICELFKQRKCLPETEVQKLWEDIFSEFFGYSRLSGEVSSQEKLHIGSTDRTIPDLVIKNGSETLFVAELKREDLPANENFRRQLISYLKQLKCHLGVLICNKICIIDYDYSKPDNEQTVIEIDFNTDNPNGVKFVELFHKENFSEENIKEFIAQKIISVQSIKKLREEISNSKELVIKLLENEFIPKYGKSEFDEVMKEFEIQVVHKTKVTVIDSVPLRRNADKLFARNTVASTIPKSDAIILCRENGFANNGKITFSSTNNGNGVFWANPNIELLSEDWWLVLNDKEEKKLYVLFIPGNSINAGELLVRADKPGQIDLQIKNDGSFIDSRSKYSFKEYFKTTIKY